VSDTAYRRLVTALSCAIVVVLLLIGSGAVYWVKFRSVANLTGCGVPKPAGVLDAGAVHAPDGGAVTLVETAFNQRPNSAVLLGAVLRNTSRYAAYRTEVTVEVHNAAGEDVFGEYRPQWFHLAIPVILPGDTAGFGTFGLFDTHPADGGDRRVTSFTVTIGANWWVPPDGLRRTMATARQIGPDILMRRGHDYCTHVRNHGYAVVLRDSAGRLIGGAYLHAVSGWCAFDEDDNTIKLIREDLPPNVDWQRSEVYALCDPVPERGPWPGKQPYNY
jgi:hypothetical protein